MMAGRSHLCLWDRDTMGVGVDGVGGSTTVVGVFFTVRALAGALAGALGVGLRGKIEFLLG